MHAGKETGAGGAPLIVDLPGSGEPFIRKAFTAPTEKAQPPRRDRQQPHQHHPVPQGLLDQVPVRRRRMAQLVQDVDQPGQGDPLQGGETGARVSRPMTGRAMFTMLPSRADMKVTAPTTVRVAHFRRVWIGASVTA